MTEMRRDAVGSGSPNGQRPFYSVAEVARMFGMSRVTVYRAIADGDFPAVRIRGRLIIPAKAVDAIVEAAVSAHGVVDVAAWAPEGA